MRAENIRKCNIVQHHGCHALRCHTYLHIIPDHTIPSHPHTVPPRSTVGVSQPHHPSPYWNKRPVSPGSGEIREIYHQASIVADAMHISCPTYISDCTALARLDNCAAAAAPADPPEGCAKAYKNAISAIYIIALHSHTY